MKVIDNYSKQNPPILQLGELKTGHIYKMLENEGFYTPITKKNTIWFFLLDITTSTFCEYSTIKDNPSFKEVDYQIEVKELKVDNGFN